MSTFHIRLAASEDDVKAAQELRYRMFYEEAGIPAPLLQTMERRDFDRFDPVCDHLLVTRKESDASAEQVVGTYRMLRGSMAGESGFIAGEEFDLSPLRRYHGDVLELGRACVDPAYRSGTVMQLLWKGIAEYITRHRLNLLFGCASFPGTDLNQVRHGLSYLYHHHLAEDTWAPRAHPDNAAPFKPLLLSRLDRSRALRELPPLIKGYLRTGAVIGEGIYTDHDLNTIDVCLMMQTGKLTSRYARHYAVGDRTNLQTGLQTQ